MSDEDVPILAPESVSHPVVRGFNDEPPQQLPQIVAQPIAAGEQERSVANAGGSAADATEVGYKDTTTTKRPGAYRFKREVLPQIYRVTVPVGVQPGDDFVVQIGGECFMVTCPSYSEAGETVQITYPSRSSSYLLLESAQLTAPTGDGGGGAVAMSPDIIRFNDQQVTDGETFLVTIPPDIEPGMQFTVKFLGQLYRITCPETAGPNMRVQIVLREQEVAPKKHIFRATIPAGVQPGQAFTLFTYGKRVVVSYPLNAVAGQRLVLQVPMSVMVGDIRLAYDSETDGWRRVVRVKDLKFQWTRLDTGRNDSKHIDLAFVRRLDFLVGNDLRMSTGYLELIPAGDAVVSSSLAVKDRNVFCCLDIEEMQGKSIAEKQTWFGNICKKMSKPFEDDHVKLCIRQSQLLTDSVKAIMALGIDDLRNRWRIELLLDEASLTVAGGEIMEEREWIQLVTEQLYNPAFGLWIPSSNNRTCVDINPNSAMYRPDDHLVMYRFLGRVIGRALFEGYLIKGHMVRIIYKHLLGWPITLQDVKEQDQEFYQVLKKLTEMGYSKVVEYVWYGMFNHTKPQLTELLLGFFDVIPEAALTIFDTNEMELTLCGPVDPLEDCETNSSYKGEFEIEGKSHRVVKWFWEAVVEEFEEEVRAFLSQFSSHKLGVRSQGFSHNLGIDSHIGKFTIHGVDPKMHPFPRLHPRLGRIDLPCCTSKKELSEKLKITLSAFAKVAETRRATGRPLK